MTMRCAAANRTVRARAVNRRSAWSAETTNQSDCATRMKTHPNAAWTVQKAMARGLTRWAGSRSFTTQPCHAAVGCARYLRGRTGRRRPGATRRSCGPDGDGCLTLLLETAQGWSFGLVV